MALLRHFVALLAAGTSCASARSLSQSGGGGRGRGRGGRTDREAPTSGRGNGGDATTTTTTTTATTTATTAGGGGGGGTIQLPSGVPKSYPDCKDVDDYPATPFEVPPFQQPFKQAPIKAKAGEAVCNANSCMDVYEFDELYVPDYELVPRDICPGGTKMLLYDGMFPGPTVSQQYGRQAMIRFHNKVDVTEPGMPYGVEERPWGIGKELHNMCKERKSRTGNPNPGFGRALTVHHHGMASLAPFDGWAEDVHCFNEYKDYVLPGSRPTMFWFHDHALGTTSENMYAGMEAVHLCSPCMEPYNMGRIPQYVVHFLDAVLDKDCQMVYNKLEDQAHHDNLWGDINFVNGVAWPVLKVQPRFVRFRILNGAVSRALQLSFDDANGKRYNDRCRIVGADGGVIGKDRVGPLGGRAYPSKRGLFTSNAYRWDVVCDFRGLEGSIFLTNEPNDNLMKPVPPMFCNSHLLMRIDISATATPSKSLFPGVVDESPSAFNDPAHMPDYTQLPVNGTVVDQSMGQEQIDRAERKALNGDWDRQFDYKKQGGYWVIADNWGWGHNIDDMLRATVADAEQRVRDKEHGSHLVATDVGQNFVEVWQLRSGGGWVHPVHAHLIQWYIVAVEGNPVYEEYPELWNVPKDSIQVGGGVGKVSVATRYGPSLGRYLFHCHNAVHEDRDMMMAFAIVPPGIGQKTAAGTGLDADIAQLFNNAGGDYNNGDLNARYGDRFYPTPEGTPVSEALTEPQALPLMAAAQEWHTLGLYNSFYDIQIPENPWVVYPCSPPNA